MGKSKPGRGRFSSQKKVEAALRDEDLDLVSREFDITAIRLSEWRTHYIARGQAGSKSRAADERDAALT